MPSWRIKFGAYLAVLYMFQRGEQRRSGIVVISASLSEIHGSIFAISQRQLSVRKLSSFLNFLCLVET